MHIDWIKEQVRQENYYFSGHANQERFNDDISICECEEAALNGLILERYENTGRGLSALLVGFTQSGKPYIVCGEQVGTLVLITVYIPSAPKFINPYTRGEK